MTDITISLCEPADLDAVAALVNAAYRSEGGWTTEAALVAGPRTTREELAADIAADNGAAIHVLKSEGEVKACVRLEKATAPDGRPVLYIGMVAVQPGLQDQGLGRKLLAHAEQVGRDAGLAAARMTVVSIRDTLIAWYVRRGFAFTGETEPFPYDGSRLGTPTHPDLMFVVLEKPLS